MHHIADRAILAMRHPRAVLKYGLLRSSLFWHSRDYVKFIVLGFPRSGSNLLLEALNSHPNTIAEREIFARLDGRSVDQILARVFVPAPRRIKAIGFKIFYRHPADDASGTVWEQLRAMPDLHIIHIKRRNLLRQLTSVKIAWTTGVYYETKRPAIPLSERRTQFTEDDLARSFRMIRAFEAKFTDLFDSHPVLELNYEDLISEPQSHFRRVTDFLDLEPALFRITLKKQNPEGLRQLISNYAELKEHFKDTEWAAFFDE